MSEPVRKNRRPLAIGLCAAAALCLLFAAFTRTWLVNAGTSAEIGFGLRSNYQCASWDKPNCDEMSNAELVERIRKAGDEKMASAAFSPMGWVTFAALLIAALGLAAAAALGAMKKTPPLPIAPTSVALLGLMAGLVTGCVFVATKPGPPGMVGIGLSFWVFGIGAVIGIAGAQMMAKLNRPPAEAWST